MSYFKHLTEDVSEFGGVDVSVSVLVEDFETFEKVFVGSGVSSLGDSPKDRQKVIQSDCFFFHIFVRRHVLFITTSKKNLKIKFNPNAVGRSASRQFRTISTVKPSFKNNHDFMTNIMKILNS